MDTKSTTENRRLLKRYLSQYYRATQKREVLEKRLLKLQAEFRCLKMTPPVSVSGCFPKKGEGGTALEVRTGDIESRIKHQIEAQRKTVEEVIDVIEYLPEESTERDILELRHIDCKTWSEICRLVHLTRSPCFEYYNRGLDRLLSFKKVRIALEAYEDRLAREARDTY